MNKGKVTLVGAGPYDMGLITVKGLRAIRKADCILYDRLINPAFLLEAPEHCEKIDVGKASANHNVPQDEMNMLLLNKALEGKDVVRLKGGDPFVFGRGAEELVLLAEHGIAFEVVPGVTSAVAAFAYAGIPVTHRDFASSLHIITGHAREGKELEIDFEQLSKLSGTLVFLMGLSSLPFICEGLLAAGRDGPAAIIENGTSARQRMVKGTVSTLAGLALKHKVKSPAIIAVGQVVELSDTLAWRANKPLSGTKVLAVCHTSSSNKLVDLLYEQGCDVVPYPCASVRRIEFIPPDFSAFNALVFTSKQGVRLFFEGLRENRTDLRVLHDIKIAAIGTETARELESAGIFADVVPDIFTGEALAHELIQHLGGSMNVLLVQPKEPSPLLESVLREEGILFRCLAVYETELVKNEPADLSDFDYVAFSSASSVSGFAHSMGNNEFPGVHAVCIGPQTAEAARKLGMDVTVSTVNSFWGMLKTIEELVKDGID